MEEQLQKYFQGQLTPDERRELMSAIRKDKSLRQQYMELQNLHALFDLMPYPGDDTKGKKNYDAFIGRPQPFGRTVKRSFIFSAVAAIAVFLLISTCWKYLYDWVRPKDSIQLIAESMKRENGGNQVKLILSGNKKIAIDTQTPDIQYNSQGEITVDKRNIEKREELGEEEKIRYNQLIVPLGKRSMLTLSDKTRLWVNAGTLVVYPEKFEKDRREIYVDGEVFFDVSHDEKRPFIVQTSGFQLTVLGTTFNVMAYRSDSVCAVVLERGAVKIKTKGHKDEQLEPSQMYTQSGRKVKIETVDVYDYISWKEGVYRFNYESLGNILKRLSRYYGVTIRSDKESSTLLCSGKLDLKENIMRVLDGLSETAPVCYQMKGEKEFLFTINSKKKDAYD